MNTDIRWQSYNFARHNIDLISANIVDIKATKSMSFSWGAKVINGLGLKQFVDEKSVKDDKFVVGLVYLTVKSNMDNLKCYLAPIQLNPFNYQKESAEIFKDILKDVLPEVNNESEKEGLFKKVLDKVSSLKNK